MKSRLIRILLLLAIAQGAYLALANLALNLPLTQSLINRHQPEIYQVHWDKAWSWYPLRVHARGVSVNGQTSSQQWQAEMSAASASLSLLPLLRRTVNIHDLDLEQVQLRLRPRVRPDRRYGAVRAFFPSIQGRDQDSPAPPRTPGKQGSGWNILVEDIHVRGSHEVWVYQVRGAFDG